MGRSRRSRYVSLTKTRKHLVGKDPRQSVLADLRRTIDVYDGIYVICTGNLRNALLKSIRLSWRDSRLYFGRKKLAQVALGRSESEEYLQGLCQVSDQLQGQVGLLFTNRSHEKVLEFFNNYSAMEYARGGNIASAAVSVEKGVLEGVDVGRESDLRRIGMPVKVDKGKVLLERDLKICEKGETLSPEQAKMLEIVEKKLVTFQVKIRCWYRKKDQTFGLNADEADTSDTAMTDKDKPK